MKVKMNYTRAILMSLPFFGITLFWQAYDTIIPQMLTYHFGFSSTAMGLVMGIDNIVALFFLPLFGALSDKCSSRLGRRTPYILYGTLGGIVGFVLLAMADQAQVGRLVAANIPQKYAAATDAVSKAALVNEISLLRQNNMPIFIMFFAALLIAVFIMSIFRAPAVALGADMFISPQRSIATAIVNAVGGSAGVVFLVFNAKLASLFGGFSRLVYVSVGVMLIALAIYMLFMRERKFAEEARKLGVELGLREDESSGEQKSTVLTPELRKSLLLILSMVILMYMGYNAYSTHFSVYAISFMGMTASSISGPLIVRVLAVLIFCVPAAALAGKIGRKMSCRIGFVFAGLALFATYWLTPDTSKLLAPIFIVFAWGFAMVSVNVTPMVVELCNDKDNGKFTGYYYLATSIAQIITPTFAGIFIDSLGYKILPIYATIFFAMGFAITFFIKHGEVKKV